LNQLTLAYKMELFRSQHLSSTKTSTAAHETDKYMHGLSTYSCELRHWTLFVDPFCSHCKCITVL